MMNKCAKFHKDSPSGKKVKFNLAGAIELSETAVFVYNFVYSGVTGMILMWIPNRNPAGGLGGAVSPPAGFGAAPRNFLKFMVSFTSEDLFWQILENFFGVLLQKFSGNERPVCNM